MDKFGLKYVFPKHQQTKKQTDTQPAAVPWVALGLYRVSIEHMERQIWFRFSGHRHALRLCHFVVIMTTTTTTTKAAATNYYINFSLFFSKLE